MSHRARDPDEMALGGGHERLDLRLHRPDRRAPELARRHESSAPLGGGRPVRVVPVERRGQQPVAERPAVEGVERQRQPVVELRLVPRQAHAEAPPDERAHRVLERVGEVVDVEVARLRRRQRRSRGTAPDPGTRSRPAERGRQVEAVERERRSGGPGRRR